MSAARFALTDYSAALKNLLPRGRVWNRESGTTQSLVMDALAASLERVDASAVQLVENLFPATSTQFLTEWDETVGIPDLCFGIPQTNAENRRQIVSKLVGSGGQSKDYFIALANALGYTITIDEFSEYTVDSTVSAPICNASWAFTWRVNFFGATIHYFTVSNQVSDPLSTGANLALECILLRYKPAHTTIIFNYED